MGKRGPNASKEKPWADALRVALLRPAEDDKQHRKNLAIIAETVVGLAKEGDMSAVREIGDRMDGKAIQQVGGDPDAPVKLVIEWAQPSKG